VLDAAAVTALGIPGAVDAITAALRSGLDPAADPARIGIGLSAGQLLLMPSEGGDAAGVKVLTLCPDNPARGLPRIQGAYLLFDRQTLALRAVLDGPALTTLRTPAVTIAALLPALPEQPLHAVLIGSGPQARAHAAALAAFRELATTRYLVRDPERAGVAGWRLGSPEADAALRAADVVICATAARAPLFAAELLSQRVVVAAIGSHEPDARELDARLLARAVVVVEDVETALREAGDVVLAIADGTLRADELLPLRDVVSGARPVARDRPYVFKSVGMSWQDLVVAEAVLAAGPG
jgi:ornithine cyclodeaminase